MSRAIHLLSNTRFESRFDAGKYGQVLAAILCIALNAACSDDSTSPPDEDDFAPTEPAILSTGSPTRDEDQDIYLTSTRDGREWTPAARVTTDAGGDFYGNLLQDEAGIFHLTWFRWTAPFLGHIWYNQSPDGLTWNPATEMQVTTVEGVDDWVPVLAQAPDGTLLVYFVSEARDDTNATSEIYMSAKGPADAAWNPAVAVSDINSATENDHLPYAARSDGSVTLIWSRYDTSEPLPWLNPKSDLYAATSTDGFVWSTPMKITNDAGNVVHLFAQIFSTLDGDDSLLWLSTRTGAPRPYRLPLDELSAYPGAIVEVSALSDGYSHRVVATSTPGIYLGVWVQGPDGEQDVYYRFFAM
jgi:hypothetical protein